jgi:hypothetical protein
MSALAFWSLMTGSLGLQAIAFGTGLRFQQSRESARLQEEEEQLTPYDSKETIDPMDDKVFPKPKKGTNDPRLIGWEFKIVRAPSDLFRDRSPCGKSSAPNSSPSTPIAPPTDAPQSGNSGRSPGVPSYCSSSQPISGSSSSVS